MLEDFARRAAETLDRRSVLGVLSAVVLATVAPFAADAKKGKSSKTKKKQKKKKRKQRRRKQRQNNEVCASGMTGCPRPECAQAAIECRIAVTGGCEQLFTSPVDIAACEAPRHRCCDFLAQCDEAGAFQCFEQVNQGG
jgi:hypothetical protein